MTKYNNRKVVIDGITFDSQKEGKNTHDDAPDALTGVCEDIVEVARPKPMRVNY